MTNQPLTSAPLCPLRGAILQCELNKRTGSNFKFSVLLLYPDYADGTGYETYYAFVEASDAIEAVAVAQRKASAAQDGMDIEPDDFLPLLVTPGHHYGEALFNK